MRWLLGLLALSLVGCAAPPKKGASEILWDKYGVPHIFAKDMPSALYAFGWAQMHSHGNLLLRAYAESRGRAAELLGAQYLEQDRLTHTLGIPKRGRQWYTQQTPQFKAALDAFAQGINDYVAANPNAVAPELKKVLPVDGSDPVTHAHRIIHALVVLPEGNSTVTYADAGRGELRDGSNSWVVSPKKSASGNAMLLANPHRAWSDVLLFYEAHISIPGTNMYGITHVGFPVLRYSFNDKAGFAQTVNPIDASDWYQVSYRPGGYAWDGGTKAFEQESVALKVLQPNGQLRSETLTIKRTIHGPVLRENMLSGVAVRLAGLDRPKMLEQYWQMALATNLEQFETALKMMQIPIYTNLYADSDGRTLFSFYGLVPDRRSLQKVEWSGLIPGDTSKTLWTKLHSYDELPKVVDPGTGFLQNTNDGPLTSTWPFQIDATKYPDYLIPKRQSLRTSRSLKLLLSEEKISLERLIELKHNTRSELADRILPELIAAAEKQGSAKAKEAARLLKSWDRTFEAQSKAAVLFDIFAEGLLEGYGTIRAYRIAPDVNKPLETPRGIADTTRALALLERAADVATEQFGRMDIPYGEVFRFRRGKQNLPAHGGSARMGLFRTFEFQPTRDGRMEAYYGDTYVAAIEFTKAGPKARVLIGYGNATQPGSKHVEDQLGLLAGKQLRPCLRTRGEVMGALEERVGF